MPKVRPDKPEDYEFQAAAGYLALAADPQTVTALTDRPPASEIAHKKGCRAYTLVNPMRRGVAVNYRTTAVEAAARFLIWNCHVPNLH